MVERSILLLVRMVGTMRLRRKQAVRTRRACRTSLSLSETRNLSFLCRMQTGWSSSSWSRLSRTLLPMYLLFFFLACFIISQKASTFSSLCSSRASTGQLLARVVRQEKHWLTTFDSTFFFAYLKRETALPVPSLGCRELTSSSFTDDCSALEAACSISGKWSSGTGAQVQREHGQPWKAGSEGRVGISRLGEQSMKNWPYIRYYYRFWVQAKFRPRIDRIVILKVILPVLTRLQTCHPPPAQLRSRCGCTAGEGCPSRVFPPSTAAPVLLLLPLKRHPVFPPLSPKTLQTHAKLPGRALLSFSEPPPQRESFFRCWQLIQFLIQIIEFQKIIGGIEGRRGRDERGTLRKMKPPLNVDSRVSYGYLLQKCPSGCLRWSPLVVSLGAGKAPAGTAEAFAAIWPPKSRPEGILAHKWWLDLAYQPPETQKSPSRASPPPPQADHLKKRPPYFYSLPLYIYRIISILNHAITKSGQYISMTEETIFDKLIRKEIPCNVVFEDDFVFAFRDIAPAAPTHIIIIPKNKDGLTGLSRAEERHEATLGKLLVAAGKIAKQEGLEKGYRVVINDGEHAGQTVFHLHVHLLGGKEFSWPPGTSL